MTPKINEKIYFSGDTSEIISDILKKYQLEETDEELAEKLFKEEPEPFIFHGAVILKTAISLAKKEFTEKDATTLLQKELNVSQTTAEGLVNEIKTQLIPLATTKKPPIENSDIGSEPIIEIKPLASIIEPIGKKATTLKEEPIGRATLPSKKQERIKKQTIPEENKESVPQPRQPKGPDSYREPIE